MAMWAEVKRLVSGWRLLTAGVVIGACSLMGARAQSRAAASPWYVVLTAKHTTRVQITCPIS